MAASRVAAGSSLQVILRGKYEIGPVVVIILSWPQFWHFRTESRLGWRGFILHSLFSQAFASVEKWRSVVSWMPRRIPMYGPWHAGTGGAGGARSESVDCIACVHT
jgi:hypothetical protein